MGAAACLATPLVACALTAASRALAVTSTPAADRRPNDARRAPRPPRARSFNRNLSILRDLSSSTSLRTHLHGDATLPIERAKKRSVDRTTFSGDERNAILASNPELRDKVALRPLLDYGLRKGWSSSRSPAGGRR